MPNYLYNGVELPALPDYDKELYPYAMIDKAEHVLIIGKSFRYGKPYNSSNYTVLFDDRVNYVLNEAGDRYITKPDNGSTIVGSTFQNILWSNFDILNEDGSVYLAASDPVPVEPEPETPDPLPVSPYLPINGAWVKHDIYKQVGNTWVKQPQGAVEVEGGAWSALS